MSTPGSPMSAVTARRAGGPAPSGSGTLADLLERVLDKGIVIVGDVVVSILDIELLTLKVRLLIASVDTAESMGIDWWRSDPFLSSHAAQLESSDRGARGSDEAPAAELERLRARIAELEKGGGTDDD